MLVSSDEVNAAAAREYSNLLAQARGRGALDRDLGQVARVQAITDRLIAQTDVFRPAASDWEWEMHVITSSEVNAWSMPGGKMAIYTGFIETLEPTDDELAAVVGHEIAHALREHARERISERLATGLVLGVAIEALGIDERLALIGNLLTQVTFTLPNSRVHEREADAIGVELAARAGFDPSEAISLWLKMSEERGGGTPEFLSTHPSPDTRIRDLREYAERVRPLYESSRPGAPPTEALPWHAAVPTADESFAVGTVRTLEAHSHDVMALAFSPGTRFLATASSDDTVRIWDPAAGRSLQAVSHPGVVHSVAFSPDGRRLGTVSTTDSTVRIWDPATGHLLRTLEGPRGGLYSVAFSPDSRLLASSTGYDGTVWIWQVATGHLLHNLEAHRHWAFSVAFGPDSRLLASASPADNTVRIWEFTTGRLLHTLDAHGVSLIAFSPDGRLLAGANGEQAVRIWDLPTGRLLRTLEGHRDHVFAVAFSADGRFLASGSKDDTVRIWDPATGRLLDTVQVCGRPPVQSVALSPDGRLLASGCGRYVELRAVLSR